MTKTHKKHSTRMLNKTWLLPLILAALILIPHTGATASSGSRSIQEPDDHSHHQPKPEAEAEAGETKPRTIPAHESVLSAPARSLRVWLPQAPDVEQSSLELEGPKGKLTVQGLHTMGENDLMARVVGPMPNGNYTATWSTMIDGEKLEGSWTFSIQRKKTDP